MWVWQSQACSGISKLTGVDGCAALARTSRLCMRAPAAMEASIIWRRVSMASLPWFIAALLDARLRPENSRLCGQCTGCSDQCCITLRDCPGGQVLAILEPDPRVEVLGQRFAVEIPHGGIESVQQAGQADAGAVENGHDAAIEIHSNGKILLVDLDQHAQAMVRLGMGD